MSSSTDKPDLVVWSEERGYYAKSLPYATNIGAPAIRPENLTAWKEAGVAKINHYLQSRFEEIKREYNELVEEYRWNELLYTAKYSFEPVVGKVYHLYLAEERPFLSLVGPKEWRRPPEYLGSFKLNGESRWQKISE